MKATFHAGERDGRLVIVCEPSTAEERDQLEQFSKEAGQDGWRVGITGTRWPGYPPSNGCTMMTFGTMEVWGPERRDSEAESRAKWSDRRYHEIETEMQALRERVDTIEYERAAAGGDEVALLALARALVKRADGG